MIACQAALVQMYLEWLGYSLHCRGSACIPPLHVAHSGVGSPALQIAQALKQQLLVAGTYYDISDEATSYACTCCCVQESPALGSGTPCVLHMVVACCLSLCGC